MSDDACDFDQTIPYDKQLELCNIQVTTCSTGSNYFHVLRRQLRRNFRKPLMNFTSKKILKYRGVFFSS
jgi:2-oxoglutarate dehydrogenase E1 component